MDNEKNLTIVQEAKSFIRFRTAGEPGVSWSGCTAYLMMMRWGRPQSETSGPDSIDFRLRELIIELYIIEDNARIESNSMQNPPQRHSRESGNPVWQISPRSGQSRVRGVVPLRGEIRKSSGFPFSRE
jgi:hypothetical protein